MGDMFMTFPPAEKADYIGFLDAIWFKLLPFVILASAAGWAWDRYKDRRYIARKRRAARTLQASVSGKVRR